MDRVLQPNEETSAFINCRRLAVAPRLNDKAYRFSEELTAFVFRVDNMANFEPDGGSRFLRNVVRCSL
jgi:hypothetical protein